MGKSGHEVGQIVRMEDRLWRVGLINDSRMRLDPLTGSVVTADPSSGRSFTSYGSSVNVSPGSLLLIVDPNTLDGLATKRYTRMQGEGVTSEKAIEPTIVTCYEFSDDADELAAVEEGSLVASAAVHGGGSKASKNKDRIASLRAKKAAGKAERASKPRAPKAERTMRPCECGCGGQTASYFVPGHDARFKGWLKKIERGEAEPQKLMGKRIADKYTWRKHGKGLVPTLNYKGEKFTPES